VTNIVSRGLNTCTACMYAVSLGAMMEGGGPSSSCVEFARRGRYAQGVLNLKIFVCRSVYAGSPRGRSERGLAPASTPRRSRHRRCRATARRRRLFPHPAPRASTSSIACRASFLTCRRNCARAEHRCARLPSRTRRTPRRSSLRRRKRASRPRRPTQWPPSPLRARW
jgi:hypothetical protein